MRQEKPDGLRFFFRPFPRRDARIDRAFLVTGRAM
jgi:hypothetical protein